MITEERMSNEFVKFHLNIGKFPILLHHFTGALDLYPHDHPFPFTTTILAGGYVEEIWSEYGGVWRSRIVERLPGTSHRVEATDIHRIIALPHGECVTSVVWHDDVPRKETLFWDFSTLPPVSRPTHHE